MTRPLSRNGNSLANRSGRTLKTSAYPASDMRSCALTCSSAAIPGQSYSRVWSHGCQPTTFGARYTRSPPPRGAW
jgi:hypothetical protein